MLHLRNSFNIILLNLMFFWIYFFPFLSLLINWINPVVYSYHTFCFIISLQNINKSLNDTRWILPANCPPVASKLCQSVNFPQ